MLSAQAESIILSALPTESMILLALFGHVIMLTAAATKKTTIGDTEGRRLTTLVNSASTAPPIGRPPKGPSFATLPTLPTDCQWGIDATMPYGGCILIPLWLVISHWLLVVGCWSLVVGCWSLVVGRWLLVVGHWSLVVG